MRCAECLRVFAKIGSAETAEGGVNRVIQAMVTTKEATTVEGGRALCYTHLAEKLRDDAHHEWSMERREMIGGDEGVGG